MQIGQDRAGFYGYDWLENLFGSNIHSGNEIRPEWQQWATGERVPLVPSGYLGPPRVSVRRRSPILATH